MKKTKSGDRRNTELKSGTETDLKEQQMREKHEDEDAKV